MSSARGPTRGAEEAPKAAPRTRAGEATRATRGPQATPRELRELLLAEKPPEVRGAGEATAWACDPQEAWPGFVDALIPSLAHTSSSIHDARALAEELLPKLGY